MFFFHVCHLTFHNYDTLNTGVFASVFLLIFVLEILQKREKTLAFSSAEWYSIFIMNTQMR